MQTPASYACRTCGAVRPQTAPWVAVRDADSPFIRMYCPEHRLVRPPAAQAVEAAKVVVVKEPIVEVMMRTCAGCNAHWPVTYPWYAGVDFDADPPVRWFCEMCHRENEDRQAEKKIELPPS